MLSHFAPGQSFLLPIAHRAGWNPEVACVRLQQQNYVALPLLEIKFQLFNLQVVNLLTALSSVQW
jgi:hypothetical protein